jgi:hypothetical protein
MYVMVMVGPIDVTAVFGSYPQPRPPRWCDTFVYKSWLVDGKEYVMPPRMIHRFELSHHVFWRNHIPVPHHAMFLTDGLDDQEIDYITRLWVHARRLRDTDLPCVATVLRACANDASLRVRPSALRFVLEDVAAMIRADHSYAKTPTCGTGPCMHDIEWQASAHPANTLNIEPSLPRSPFLHALRCKCYAAVCAVCREQLCVSDPPTQSDELELACGHRYHLQCYVPTLTVSPACISCHTLHRLSAKVYAQWYDHDTKTALPVSQVYTPISSSLPSSSSSSSSTPSSSTLTSTTTSTSTSSAASHIAPRLPCMTSNIGVVLFDACVRKAAPLHYDHEPSPRPRPLTYTTSPYFR